jgi:hypothetical protein
MQLATRAGRLPAAADFDSNGVPDLVWHNNTKGLPVHVSNRRGPALSRTRDRATSGNSKMHSNAPSSWGPLIRCWPKISPEAVTEASPPSTTSAAGYLP